MSEQTTNAAENKKRKTEANIATATLTDKLTELENYDISNVSPDELYELSVKLEALAKKYEKTADDRDELSSIRLYIWTPRNNATIMKTIPRESVTSMKQAVEKTYQMATELDDNAKSYKKIKMEVDVGYRQGNSVQKTVSYSTKYKPEKGDGNKYWQDNDNIWRDKNQMIKSVRIMSWSFN